MSLNSELVAPFLGTFERGDCIKDQAWWYIYIRQDLSVEYSSECKSCDPEQVFGKITAVSKSSCQQQKPQLEVHWHTHGVDHCRFTKQISEDETIQFSSDFNELVYQKAKYERDSVKRSKEKR